MTDTTPTHAGPAPVSQAGTGDARRSLQKRFLILVGTALAVLVGLATAAVAWLQWTQMVHNVEEFSDNELHSLHALIVEAMAIRVEDFDDIGVRVFNNWFDRRNIDYPGEVWSSWSAPVVAYMADVEPDRAAKLPRDPVDQEALATGQMVGRMEGNVYRRSLPIVLGVTPGAEQENCHACHGAMGLEDGDVIAVLSSALDLTAKRTRLEAIVAALIAAGAILMVVGVALVRVTLVRSVTGPVAAMTRTMRRLAGGDTDLEIPGAGRDDEIGAMAQTVEVFRQNAVARTALEDERARVAAAREQRLVAMQALITRFEDSVAQVLGGVSGSTDRLSSTADEMTKTAQEAAKGSDRTAEGAAGASASVQTVSAAAEELNASIAAISGEVAQSSAMSNDAVASAKTSFERVRELETAVARIANIANLINSIAGKTNLRGLTRLRTLYLTRSKVSDAGLVYLRGLTSLRELRLENTKVTDAGVNQLSRALPKCRVRH